MPAKSKAQQKTMAIALHSPSKLYSRNKGLAKMSKSDLRDFAETKRKGLPERKTKIKKKKRYSSSGFLA